MVEEQAHIISVTGQHIVIEVSQQSSCSGCSAKSSCGTSTLSRFFGQKKPQFQLDIGDKKLQNLSVGDTIMIGLEESFYIKASILIYLLPLLTMFGLALIADQFSAHSDLLVMTFAMTGLWLGFKLASLIAASYRQMVEPQFLKKL